MTNSVAADGQTTMTGALKSANGTAGAPSITFASDLDSGFYRKAANSIALSLEGVDRVVWSTASASFAGGLTIAGEFIASATAAFIMTASFSAPVKSLDTGYWLAPVGSTAQRPGTPAEGMFRQNSTTHLPEMHNGTSWSAMQALLVPGAFKNLSIKVASNTTVAVAADFVAVTDGSSYQLVPVSSTINLGTTGADALDAGSIAIDTWYAIWVIAKSDGTTKCLASTSASAPTMPTGYTFKARYGWVQTIHGSATLYGTWQLGRRAQYVVGLAQTSAYPTIGTTSSASLTALPLARFVPTTASEINVVVGNATSSANFVSPNASTAVNSSVTNPSPVAHTIATSQVTAGNGSIVLESTNIYAACSAGTVNVLCPGWTDNI